MTKVTEQTRFGVRKLAALLGVGAAFGVATCLANPFDDVKYMFSGGVDADGNGVAKVKSLTYNGRKINFDVSHEKYPAWVMGRGMLYVQPRGTIIMFR